MYKASKWLLLLVMVGILMVGCKKEEIAPGIDDVGGNDIAYGETFK